MTNIDSVLTPEDALSEALLSLGTAYDGECMIDVDFWTYAEHLKDVGGSAGWALQFRRRLGHKVSPEIITADELQHWYKIVISKWREVFFPTPAVAANDVPIPVGWKTQVR